MGIYSEKVIRDLNEQLDPRAVLELINYHSDKLQESGETLRGFCPIHRETVFRTLIIDKSKRTFRCMYSLCKGAAGGTLVELYALAQDIPLEKAVEELAGHFQIEVRMTADPEFLEKQAEVAENYLELGFYEDAEKVLREIVEADSNYERAHRGLLEVYKHLGNTEALGEHHGILAQLLIQRGERLAAYEHVKAWAEYQPDAPKAHYLLAEYLREQGDLEAALEEFMAAADLYAAKEDFQAAIDAYRQADSLRLDVVDVVPHVLQIYEQMGKPTEAVAFLSERAEASLLHADFARSAQLLEQALELAPNDPSLRARLCEIAILADTGGDWLPRVFEWAQWFVESGMPEKAVQVYERVLGAQPTNEEAVERLRALYAAMGRTEDALGLRVRAARVALDAKEFATARKELQAILEEKPDHAAALELLAEVNLAAGHRKEAADCLARLARVCVANRDFSKAVSQMERVLSLVPDDPRFLLDRAEILENWASTGNVRARQQAVEAFEALGDRYAQTDPQKACDMYRRSEACAPPSAQLLLKQARCQAKLRAFDAAREYLQRACDELVAVGQPDVAVEAAREIAAMAPHDHGLQRYLIELLEVIGRIPEAVEVAMLQADAAAQRAEKERVFEYLNYALALDPDHIPAIEALALHYHGTGDIASYCDVLLRLANANEQRGNITGAVAALERVVDERPEDVMALGRLANLHLNLGNAAKSRAYRLELAQIHHRRGALESEREILRALLEEDPEEENVLAALIDCEFGLGNREQACARAVELARLQMKRGFAAQARTTLEKAIAKEPDDLGVNRLLFELVRQLGSAQETVERGLHLVELLQLYEQLDDAVAVFEQTTEADPNNFELFRKYVAFLREIGRTEETLEKLFAIARRLRASGQFEEAEKALLEIEQSRPLDIPELEEALSLYEQWGKPEQFAQRAIELARTYETSGQDKKTLTLLRRALKVTNGHPEVRRELAEAYARQGRPADAVRELVQLADAFVGAGKRDDELETLRRAVALVPTERQVRLRLVNALIERGDREAAVLQLEDLAAALMTSKDYENALEVLNRIIEEFPSRLGARRMRAEVYSALGQNKAAQEDLNVFYVKSLLRQADDYHTKNDFTREAATLREALNIIPSDEELLRRIRSVEFEAGELDRACSTTLELAKLLTCQNRPDDALELLRETHTRVPDNLVVAEQLFETLAARRLNEEAAMLGETLAELYRAAGESGKALAAFSRAVDLASDSEQARLRFAQFLERAGETAQAVATYLALARQAIERSDLSLAQVHYEQALRIDPSCVPAHEGMAEVAARRGNHPEQAVWLQKLAEIWVGQKATEEAIDALRRAIYADPRRIDLRQHLIELLEKAQRPADAVAELHALADVLTQEGRQAEALAAEERAVALCPKDPKSARRLAEMLIMLNEVERGVNEFERLSGLYAELGEYPQALAVLEEAQTLAPARLSVRRLKAEIYERMGETAQAEEERRQFEVAKSLQEAEVARERNDFKAEKRALRKALEVAPQDEGVWLLLIRCHRDLGDTQAEVDAYLKLAEVQREKHGLEKAMATLEQAYAQQPNEERLVQRLFELARERRDDVAVRRYGERLIELAQNRTDAVERTITVYDELLSYAPLDADLYLEAADHCARVARPAEALERLHRGADLFAEAERWADAERLLLRTLEMNPKSTESLARLVRLYERVGRTDEFERRLLELAKAYDENGERPHAIETVRRLTLVSPDNVEARRYLVRLLAAAEQKHAAIEEQLALVFLLRQQGALSDAVEAARDAVAMSEGSDRARRALAECLLAAGNTDAANAELEDLAKSCVERGDLQEALQVLDEIIERTPQRMSTRVLRAEVYVKLGQAERALEEYRQISTAVAAGAMTSVAAPSAPAMPSLQIVSEYDFEHFVVGANNNFAYATALAVARAPAQAYNPLFIYSDVGLGKTHLVNAIANHILRENPNVRIIYTNSEDFTAEVVEAIQTNTINQFRAKYKSVDLLIVDDVQFLAGKERAQEEFFHIFNALFQAKKQIVITSDRPPKDIARLENRLLSRFGAGVIVDIAPPDLETRIAILNREIERGEVDIPDAVVQLIAETIDTNVRELKGALNQVMAMHTIQGKEINTANVRQMLESLYARPTAVEKQPPQESAKDKKKKS
ncbi:MAG: tetratricopeptide repeat protein [Candidatus Sumerlaeaceae bacterium]